MASRRHVSALAVFALGGLLLTGCAAGSTSSEGSADSEGSGSNSESTDMNTATDQSVAEACADLQSTLSESASALQSGMSEFTTDPALAVESLNGFAAEFATARDSLGNAEVKAQADKAGVALDEMIGSLETGVADPASLDMESFMATVTDVQTELTAIGEVCAQ